MKPVTKPRFWDIDLDVHTRHCCKIEGHGCKYGQDSVCTVQITDHPGMTGHCMICFDEEIYNYK